MVVPKAPTARWSCAAKRFRVPTTELKQVIEEMK